MGLDVYEYVYNRIHMYIYIYMEYIGYKLYNL